MKLLITLLTITLLAITSCDTTDPKPPAEKPSGYQEDIPWPSLADSPWPMGHHDPQSTGRSQYVGPQLGIYAGTIDAYDMRGSITIGYTALYFAEQWYFNAVDYEGIEKWDTLIGRDLFSSPLIDADTIVYMNSLKRLYAFYPNGKIKWILEDEKIDNQASLTIGLDSTLYIVGWDNMPVLLAISKLGKLKWSYKDNRIWLGYDVKPSFSPNGKILYLQGQENVTLLAFDIESQTIKWTFGNQTLESSPVVDSQGNIYVFGGERASTFYSLNPSGEIRWSYQFNNVNMENNIEPSIDKNGNLYFGVDTLYSLDYEGNLRWKYGMNEGENIVCSIVCDIEGNVFLGILHSYRNTTALALNSFGEKLWAVNFTDIMRLNLSPSITDDGTLLFPASRSEYFPIIK
jgi:outer membrane protein assembly factor BamB